MNTHRPASLRRSWLFVPGADDQAIADGPGSGADVLIQEMEDFCRPEDRPRARMRMPDVIRAWRESGAMTAVRINPLAEDGVEDLEAAMVGKPDIIALPKVDGPEKLIELDERIWQLEWANGIEQGATEILPNVELARGLVQTLDVCHSTPRIKACLIASEDMAMDLGAERGRDGLELLYPRQRFIVECVAAGVVAVDCPWTFSDDDGLDAETRLARRLGYVAKSAVHAAHVSTINDVMSPAPAAIEAAQRIVSAFEEAREAGLSRVEVDGSIVEVPYYTNAVRLLERASALSEYGT